MRIETRLTQVGTRKERQNGAINVPIYLSTAYEHIDGQSTGYDYTRTGNPTRHVLEETLAELEGGDGGFACSSGMAAIQTVLSLFSQGDHLIVSLDLYGGTYRLFEQVLSRLGLSFSYIDLRKIDEVEAAIQQNTKAIFVETPTNPLMQVTDIRTIAQLAIAHDLLTIVDNTFCTPYLQRPLELGADIVVHSATKYLGGHNDLLAGAIISKGVELTEQIGFLHNTIGATLAPFDAFLLLRGLKTLAIRMDQHQRNATKLVGFLQQHRCIESIFYPSLDQDGHAIHSSQADGDGGMLSFRLQDVEQVQPFLRRLQLITYAESLGGVESFITYPATQTHADIPVEIREAVGVCDRLLRMSVGIEHVDDLIADLEQALDNK
ncbi:cystathionine gamma-synthase [Seinonella peptonophila]|uniref:Cystathionine gamma-synthase n=1 Tax=Seinonella peptonophila TaxID=112248 RepID=A0A1M4VFZ5_9BACL|nr:aminotransferase class I/II-fold pyridoxal phosphate-dependent enzyme [Seinonella peptonophila]SHE67822.1 cystathionine gamma-synthase [Seinonella peptonophila]